MNDEKSETRKRNNMSWKDDKLIVETRSGKVFELEEQLGSVLEDAAKVATTKKQQGDKIFNELNETVLYNTLICKSCVEPVLNEMDFDITKLKGSEMVLLKKAIMELYDIHNFLK